MTNLLFDLEDKEISDWVDESVDRISKEFFFGRIFIAKQSEYEGLNGSYFPFENVVLTVPEPFNGYKGVYYPIQKEQ